MDFNVGLEDVGIAALQELWNRVTLQGMELARETSDVLVEKDRFQEFSRSISQINIIFQAMNTRKVEAEIGSEFTKAALGKLNSQLEKACKIIKDCKSGSRFRVFLQSRSKLSQMQELAKEIAKTISSFRLVTLNIGLNLKNMVAETIDHLHTMEFQSSVATEAIAYDIQSLMKEDRKNREKSLKLLEKIAEAVGANAGTSLVLEELEMLEQEKEEMEAQKKQAEALQLSQLIQLLYSTEIIAKPPDEEEFTTYRRNNVMDSFLCPLCNEMMVDPVAIVCGHSFERKAIKHYFESGETTCPVCKEELSSVDVTPNISLRGTIEEWKQRDRDFKFQAAIEGVRSDDHSRQNSSLVELQYLMEVMPSYAGRVAEENLIPKFVNFLKDKRLNAEATLKCLYCLAKDSEVNKDVIVGAGAIRRIMKQIYKHQYESIAIALLLELSKKETIAEKIGDTKNWILLLVSMLHNNQGNVSEIAHKVLQNLSYNTHFVVKMAEAGYFKPFITRFIQGSQETRAMMAAALVQMQAIESSINDLKNEQFVHCLVQMLSSSSPACKSASLKAIKKFTSNSEMIKQLLADTVTIPLLVALIIYEGSDSHLKGEAVEILALLVGHSESGHFQMYHGLKELQSKHNVTLFLQLASSSDPQTKIQFLHLLVELSNKSEEARSLIRSDGDAIVHLFSCLHGDQPAPAVKKWAMKLLHSFSGHPNGIPVPESPGKEIAVNTLASILTYSPDVEERTIAAGIISQLPRDDVTIDDMLRKSEVLKAIYEVISGMDVEQNHPMRDLPNQSHCLLENALAALLRYTEPTKPELHKQVGKLELHPSLIRVLSRGTSLAKERTAMVLAHLSQSTSLSFQLERNLSKEANNSSPFLNMTNYFPRFNWCCSPAEKGRLCPVHGAACLSKDAFCLVKADALEPLIQSLSDTAPGVQEAALMALETLLTDSKTLSQAAAAIVDHQGLVAILQVLQKGSLPAKLKALDLYQKILSHTSIPTSLFAKIEGVLIQLLHEGALRKKAALVLSQMNVIPEQSSYF